jgi:hypothetical protein
MAHWMAPNKLYAAQHFHVAYNSAVVVKFYLGDAKKFDDFFWKAESFDDHF